MGKAEISSSGDPAVRRLSKDADSRVLPGCHNLGSSVGGSVVYDQDFEAVHGLPEDALDGPGQDARPVESRDYDAE
jgi:hypothetical protein